MITKTTDRQHIPMCTAQKSRYLDDSKLLWQTKQVTEVTQYRSQCTNRHWNYLEISFIHFKPYFPSEVHKSHHNFLREASWIDIHNHSIKNFVTEVPTCIKSGIDVFLTSCKNQIFFIVHTEVFCRYNSQ